MVVFATPLYYYGMTAQLKTVVDRFCAYNSSLNSRHLKSALLTVAWNADDWTFDALETHYKTLVRYINFLRCSRHDQAEPLSSASLPAGKKLINHKDGKKRCFKKNVKGLYSHMKVQTFFEYKNMNEKISRMSAP